MKSGFGYASIAPAKLGQLAHGKRGSALPKELRPTQPSLRFRRLIPPIGARADLPAPLSRLARACPVVQTVH